MNTTQADNTETVASFDQDGNTYEIDHLGVANPRQWGDFAVYRDGEQVGEFSADASWFTEGNRPNLPNDDELIELAQSVI